jgi:hypothetical protein
MPSYQRERYPIIAVKARPAVEKQSNAAEDVYAPAKCDGISLFGPAVIIL